MSEFTQEEKDFIKNLSKEMIEQDNRATAAPYSYRVQQDVRVYGEDDRYVNRGVRIEDEHYDNLEDALEYVLNWMRDEDEGEGVAEISEDEMKDWLDNQGSDWSYYSWGIEHRLCHGYQGGTNAFWTEKACEAYIESNRHNLSNPISYVVNEYRNPEMEKLQAIVHKLAEML